jgi:hypothetical protein
MFAAALVLGPTASAQTQVQLPDMPTRMPVHASQSGPPPLSGDMQDVSRVTFAVTFNLLKHDFVVGLPFAASGAVVVEQTLADGSTVRNSNDVAVWRDTEGKLRVEYALKLPGMDSLHRMVMVMDPKNGTTMTWSIGRPEVHVVMSHRLPAVVTNGTDARPPIAPVPRSVTLPDIGHQGSQNVSSEDLPADTIAGLYVTGVRITTIIPAGTAGNERDITVTSETWTSPDLKITVRQISDDPRSAKVTTELTDITRTDPDPALFQAPEGYSVRDMSLPMPTSH